MPAEPAISAGRAKKALIYGVLKDYLDNGASPRRWPPDIVGRSATACTGNPISLSGSRTYREDGSCCSKLFKGCVPPKDISLVSHRKTPTDACDVFEGFFDFLSAATLGVAEGNDAVVLNSVGNLAKSFSRLDVMRKSTAGWITTRRDEKTFDALRARYKEKVVDCSGLYAGCKDLNEHLQKKLQEKTTNNKTLKFRL